CFGCRAGPGVDWHRSSQSSKGPARTEKPVYSFNEPPIIPGYVQLAPGPHEVISGRVAHT
ncbi:MAG: hypothetical protein ACLPKT_15830, partial [Methylocella sp.]